MMKKTAKSKVYVRSGTPSRTSAIIGQLEPGFAVEVEEKIKGEEWKDNDQWFVDKFDQFYWSGAFIGEGSSETPAILDVDYSNYTRVSKAIELFDIGKLWKFTKGKDVRVALLDSGVDSNHDQLIDAISSRTKHSNMRSVEDVNGHGTQMAGIIGGRNTCKNLIGVAPKCSIISYKLFHKSNRLKNLKLIADGINAAINKNVDIISISIGGPSESIELMEIVPVAHKKGITIVASAGDDARFVECPAYLPEVISVGSMDINGERWKLTEKTPKVDEMIDFVAPGTDILTSGLSNSFVRISGTSPAAAFMTGIIALIISYYRNKEGKDVTPGEIKELLIHSTYKPGSTAGYGNGYLISEKLIKNLTK